MIPIANASTVLNLPFSPFFHRPRIILIPQTLIQKCYINTKKHLSNTLLREILNQLQQGVE